MTNAELISKIRKEIERLIEESDFDESANLYSLLSFLSTFEKESEEEKRVPTRIYLGSKYEFIRRDIIQKEIEGLKKNSEVSDNKEYAPYELDVACGYDMACDDILSFLSTIEEQPKEVRNPIFDECVSRVDPEVMEEVSKNIDFELALYDHFGQVKDFTLGMRIGKYFYELGCRRTAEKYDEIEYSRQRTEECVPNDLQEYASSAGFDYVDNIVQEHPGHRFNDHDVEYAYRDGIIAGARWQKEQDEKEQADLFTIVALDAAQRAKEQMLKEAVEGEVHPDDCEIWVNLVGYGYKFNDGDKVKIIIVKE